MNILKHAFLAILGFSSGAIISAGVFAFITVIGVLPRLAQKSKTERFAKLYEEMILAGGLFGCAGSFWNFKLCLGSAAAVLFSLCGGVFTGALAVSLAETLDVIPVLTRRVNVVKGLFFFVMALALGKLAGSILYFSVGGFK